MSMIWSRKLSCLSFLAICVGVASSACVVETDGDDDDDAAGSAGAGGSGSGSAGASGRGGSSSGGSAGTAGSAGSAGAGGSVNSACGALQTPAEAEPNDENGAATAYTLGATAQGCVATADDIDAFTFTVPDDGTGGGVLLEFTGVGPGALSTRVYVEGDNGALAAAYEPNQGANLTHYFAAAPGRKYYVQVESFSGTTFGYTMKATYTPVADAFEPNDTRETATPIGLNMPYSAYYFAGFTSAAKPAEAQLNDYYKVNLGVGLATFTLSQAPATYAAQADVTAPDNNSATTVGTTYTVTRGGDLTFGIDAKVPGDYVIRLINFQSIELAAMADALPEHFTKPYQITVTQP